MRRHALRLTLLILCAVLCAPMGCKKTTEPTDNTSEHAVILSVTVEPTEGTGEFNVTVKVGPHTAMETLEGSYGLADGTGSQHRLGFVDLTSSGAPVEPVFTFNEIVGGDYRATFVLRDLAGETVRDTKAAPFKVVGALPATLTFAIGQAAINEPVDIYEHGENFARSFSNPNCWNTSAGVLLTIARADGALNGYCMWTSTTGGFTIESTLTGTLNVAASTMDFWLQQTVSYDGGGTTIKLWHGVAQQVTANSAGGTAGFTYTCSVPSGALTCATLREGSDPAVRSLRLTGTVPWTMTW
jgi:hypothetical protein